MTYMDIKNDFYKTTNRANLIVKLSVGIVRFLWHETCAVTHLRAKMALISPIRPPPPPPPPPPIDELLLRLESALLIGAAGAPSSCWGQQKAKRHGRVQQTWCRHDDSRNTDGCRYHRNASRNRTAVFAFICIITQTHKRFQLSPSIYSKAARK